MYIEEVQHLPEVVQKELMTKLQEVYTIYIHLYFLNTLYILYLLYTIHFVLTIHYTFCTYYTLLYTIHFVISKILGLITLRFWDNVHSWDHCKVKISVNGDEQRGHVQLH